MILGCRMHWLISEDVKQKPLKTHIVIWHWKLGLRARSLRLRVRLNIRIEFRFKLNRKSLNLNAIYSVKSMWLFALLSRHLATKKRLLKRQQLTVNRILHCISWCLAMKIYDRFECLSFFWLFRSFFSGSVWHFDWREKKNEWNKVNSRSKSSSKNCQSKGRMV